jgi:hypothetical protein
MDIGVVQIGILGDICAENRCTGLAEATADCKPDAVGASGDQNNASGMIVSHGALGSLLWVGGHESVRWGLVCGLRLELGFPQQCEIGTLAREQRLTCIIDKARGVQRKEPLT